MDFFAAQDDARRRTGRLIWLFVAAVAVMVLGIYLAFMAALGEVGYHGWWDPQIFFTVTLLVVAVVGLSSLSKIVALRSGGSAVAESVGGRRLDPRTADPAEQRLLNIVEEMAIASGVAVPAVFVLPNEESINAFAAGFSPDDAAVAFTRGSLEKLNRDELQGVVAHEFAHILNGDMRLNIHLIGVLFGILVLSILGRVLLRVAFVDGQRHRGRNNREAASFAAVAGGIGLVLLIAGSVGVFFGRLIQSAVSRQREYLADAAAVQFTRHPDGLSSALRKIGAAGSRVQHPHSQDVAHLFFANGLRSPLAGWFATHPPLERRILALDASWDGSFVSPVPARPAAPPPGPEAEKATRPEPRIGGARLVAAAVAADALARATAIHGDLQHRVGAALSDPLEARALVLALLINDSQPAAHAVQMDYVRGSAGEDLEEAVARQRAALRDLPEEERLALVEMVLPTLSLLEGRERADLLQWVRRIVLADGQITWFAFATGWIVRRHLQPPTHLRPIDNPAEIARPTATLLGFLAWMESGESDGRAAFDRAVAGSEVLSGKIAFPAEPPDYEQLDDALQVLSAANFALRREVLDAVGRLVLDDGEVSAAETEVVRFAAAALDCPAPLPG